MMNECIPSTPLPNTNTHAHTTHTRARTHTHTHTHTPATASTAVPVAVARDRRVGGEVGVVRERHRIAAQIELPKADHGTEGGGKGADVSQAVVGEIQALDRRRESEAVG